MAGSVSNSISSLASNYETPYKRLYKLTEGGGDFSGFGNDTSDQTQQPSPQIQQYGYHLKKIHAYLLAIQNTLERLILVGELRQLYIMVTTTRNILLRIANNLQQYADKLPQIVKILYQLVISYTRQLYQYTDELREARS